MNRARHEVAQLPQSWCLYRMVTLIGSQADVFVRGIHLLIRTYADRGFYRVHIHGPGSTLPLDLAEEVFSTPDAAMRRAEQLVKNIAGGESPPDIRWRPITWETGARAHYQDLPFGAPKPDGMPMYRMDLCRAAEDHAKCPEITMLRAGQIDLGPVTCSCVCHQKRSRKVESSEG